MGVQDCFYDLLRAAENGQKADFRRNYYLRKMFKYRLAR